MARVFTDAILPEETLYSQHSPTLNLKYGGQGGYLPAIGMVGPDGKAYSEWISNHAYVKRNIIPVMLQAPRMFNYTKTPNEWIGMWKAVMESHPSTIDGLNSTLSVDTDEHPVGNAGEKQEEVTNVTRATSAPSYSFKEKAGKAFTKLFDFIIRYGMMDPDTKTPLIAKLINSIDDIGGLYLPDMYTTTMLYIEPDVTQLLVNDAWLCVNMFPKGGVDRTGKRDGKSGGETVDVSVEFSAITMNNTQVIKFARGILKGMTTIKAIPEYNMVLPVTEIDPTVKAQKAYGFDKENTTQNFG